MASKGSKNTDSADNGNRRSQAERRAESMQKILDCAEINFARMGFYGVTLNDIAQQCEVPTALIRYYYDDKGALLHAVLNRRAAEINAVRLGALDDYRASAGANMTIEGVLGAYLDPVLTNLVYQREEWRTYGTLVSQMSTMPAWGGVIDLPRDYFDPVVNALLDMLRQLGPGISDQDLFWYYHMLSGALTMSLSQNGNIDRVSNGLCKSSDTKAMAAQINTVYAAGFRALLHKST